MTKRLVVLLTVTVVLIISCKNNPSNSNSGEYAVLNEWIRGQMNLYYFWDEIVPEKAPGDIEPEDFFDSILETEDVFSFISDDAVELLADLNGSSFTSGISPGFGRFSESNDVFIVVEFVYPNTPAAEAGIERGDIIITINSESLNTENYLDLFYSESASTLGLGVYDSSQNTIITSDEIIVVGKAQLGLDPVVVTNIYEYDNHKIGYVFYAAFVDGETDQFIVSLNNTLTDFKNAGVTELIVDLRYNPGGKISASKVFANALAPISNTQNEDVFVSFQYNEGLQEFYSTEQGPDSPNLISRFSEGPVNLGLERVYFLTTNGSASASELLINGLEPYMDVYSIGENTFGKFYGAFVLTGANANPPNNYAIAPVTLKYLNALGVTDFRDGLEPDFPAQENIFEPFSLGDVEDPLLSVAIEHIRNGVVVAKVKEEPLPYTLLEDPIRLKKGNILFQERK